MLKIRDNVDLKELKKYGFNRIKYLPLYQKTIFYYEKGLYCYFEYQVNTKDRYIKISTNIDFIIDNTIYDLIKADLIEKVSDE